MRKSSLFLIALVFIFSAFVTADDWKSYAYKELGCKVSFPVEPKGSTQDIPTEIGNVTVTQYIAEIDEQAFLLAANEYPEKYISAKSSPEVIENALEGGITGAAGSIQGEILDTKDIKVGKYPGKQATISFQNGEAIDVLQIFLVGNKMYQLQAIGMKNSTIEKDALLFFNTFKLL